MQPHHRFLSIFIVLVTLLAVLGNPRLARAEGPLCYVDSSPIKWAGAYSDLQSAIANVACTEIWVAEGVYSPTSSTDRAVSFQLRSGLAIYGGFKGNETLRDQHDPAAYPTVLSGEIGAPGNADNSYHVVESTRVNATAVLDGFTITAGNANTRLSNSGGGMYNNRGRPTLTNVTFSGNKATNGGGMYNNSSSPTLTNVTFSGNTADYSGGGMYNNNSSSPILTNVTFSGNIAGSLGGGIHNWISNPTLTNVTFSGNEAKDGGGMYNNSSRPNISNTILWGDTGGEISPERGILTDSIVQGGCPARVNCTNIIDANPYLGSLRNNGGYTQTMDLAVSSSAVDTGGVNSTCAATDQRGIPRPQGTRCDIGAYELVQTGVLGNPPSVVGSSVPGEGPLLQGQQYTSGFSQITVRFDQDVRHDGSARAADNPANYRLVQAGANGVQTTSCRAGISGGDTTIPINKVTYTNNGGAGPFEATLSLNGGKALPNGTYRLLVCGTTSIYNFAGDKLYAGLTDYSMVFIIGQIIGNTGGGGGVTKSSSARYWSR